MTRVLLLAPDELPQGRSLAAGPGIRYAEMAAALEAAGHEVTVAEPPLPADDASPPDERRLRWSDGDIAGLVQRSGAGAVVLGQGHAELGRQVARKLPAPLPVVVDCYAPGIIEHISLAPSPAGFDGFRRRTLDLVSRGDLFLVANERQRLYTLGLLSAAGRLNPRTFDAPPLMEVPYGVPADPPTTLERRLGRGILVPEDVPLVIWYGGVYPWFDAATAVRGFARALERVPDAHMLIVGGRHPRAHAPERELTRALAEVERLGLAERVREAPWGPYEERVGWYAEADCAICLHHPGVEADLSHRTRLVDMLWGRLPFICTQGDAVGEVACRAGAAVAIPPHDEEAAGQVLGDWLSDRDALAARREAAAEQAERWAWPTVLAPLSAWLEEPRVAADRIMLGSWRDAAAALVEAARRR